MIKRTVIYYHIVHISYALEVNIVDYENVFVECSLDHRKYTRRLIRYWPVRAHDMLGRTGDPSVLKTDDFAPLAVRQSVGSRALRSGDLGSSEWGTLWWIVK